MRLPTIYETNTTYAWAPILADGDGIKASLAVGKGVPFVPGFGYWTASARKSNSNDWWVLTNGGVAYGSPAGGAASVRCVLPNSY